MATLLESLERGEIAKIDAQLAPREQELRCAYASPKLQKWLSGQLPNLGSTWKIDQTPMEQLDAYLAVYASGAILTFGHSFNPIRHVAGGVWELKTADLRVFGWFPKKDHFIGHAANLAQAIKDGNLYNGYAGEVAYFRDRLDLNDPKFIPGDNPNDVISAYRFP
ncbi:MAG: hypothetical protein SH859_07635 [Hyphomicrobium aestuarii]|nr:hypothetical protein [Hyphomicrobium aestuarii]